MIPPAASNLKIFVDVDNSTFLVVDFIFKTIFCELDEGIDFSLTPRSDELSDDFAEVIDPVAPISKNVEIPTIFRFVPSRRVRIKA